MLLHMCYEGCEDMIYLDNSATTKPCDKAITLMNKALTENWGNPSSLHILGMYAEIALNNARKIIAKSISAKENEIIFTSCGTEANNMAVMSALSRKSYGNRIITTAIEHPSVLEAVKKLENEGFEVIYLHPDKNGVISLDDLKNCLNSKTVLVSIMMVNNELGSIQPISEAAKLIKSLSPNALFHCDAVQGYGKLPISVTQLGVDLLTASGHKIHAPKGIGFLYCKSSVHINPLIVGGGQEKGLRSGTESLPLIAALQGAVEDLPNLQNQLNIQKELFKYAKELFLKSNLIKINSCDDGCPYVLNISLLGYRSETILHFLENKEIYVSSGSACSKGKKSYVLKEIGLLDNEIDSAIRISFSRYNTKQDVDMLFEALLEASKKIRKAN